MRLKLKKAIQLIAIIMIGVFLVATVVVFARKESTEVLAAAGPIPPPVGYPKLTLSTKVVSPTLVYTDGAVLEYSLEIVNTGAYQALDVSLVDVIPNHTTYNNDVTPPASFSDGAIRWQHGVVGFDSSVLIKFSVTVAQGYQGLITNTAVISDPMIAEPVTVTAETRVAANPLFEISKSATPGLPGALKPLTYELVVTNQGQPAVDTPITVTDFVPADTTFHSAGQGGFVSPDGDIVTWTQVVSMAFGESTSFTFTVDVGDVQSGTVIHNGIYKVDSPFGFAMGKPYTTTVVDPVFLLSKSIFPDPPGSNAEMTYTITVLNLGSKATDLVVTDVVPDDIEYLRGGSYNPGTRTVTWDIPELDTRESAEVSFTGFIADIADVIVLNGEYRVCSAEDVCASGPPVESLIVGPTFEVNAILDPIAHKPGGGTAPVTPTLTVKNIGPGNALDATAIASFGRLSVNSGVIVLPSGDFLPEGPSCSPSYKCLTFIWTGDLAVGEVITITSEDPASTVGGGEGTHYTATVVVTDQLGAFTTEPVTATAVGHVTHFANLIPTKSAPAEIGPGQEMTYTIQVFDSGLSTEETPPPVLTETVPASVTLLRVSDGGVSREVGGETVISWTLPGMSPGESLYRSFGVRTDSDLVSGMLIINDDYRTTWYESELTNTVSHFMSNLGVPVTTTVREVGLIDSFKTVTPTLALPGEGITLTYVVHVVNSGPLDLEGVHVTDIFPWEHTTYQRDAIASVGTPISDIVSLEWTGNLVPYSEELITFTVLVDDFFEGVVTNTATISYPGRPDIIRKAVAYITDDPVLFISKVAAPDPVTIGSPLLYQVFVTNLGQKATQLVVTDTVPANTVYIDGSASSGGQLEAGVLKWELPVLDPQETLKLTFQVTVAGGEVIGNERYAVRCAEGVFAYGEPVYTNVRYPHRHMYMPIINRH